MITTSIHLNDTHIPYHDPVSVGLTLDFIKDKKPDKLILQGDICDFYSCSRFNKDPARIDSLQDDLDQTLNFLDSCRQAAPDAEIHYIQGNHERRLQRYMWNQAQALSSLRALKLPVLLKFKELKINYHLKFYKIGDLHCTHGTVIRRHAGYTAKAEFDNNGCSGMSGHTHRDGKYTVRNRTGHFVWFENYCLCDLNPEYIEGIANWTQGFSVVTTVGKRPYVEQIPIIGHKYIYNGKIVE